MTTFAPHPDTLDERTREAWSAYRDELVELHGREYDAAETDSWERLQEALRTIDGDRSAPPTTEEPHA
jgi:hypothetical protein